MIYAKKVARALKQSLDYFVASDPRTALKISINKQHVREILANTLYPKMVTDIQSNSLDEYFRYMPEKFEFKKLLLELYANMEQSAYAKAQAQDRRLSLSRYLLNYANDQDHERFIRLWQYYSHRRTS